MNCVAQANADIKGYQGECRFGQLLKRCKILTVKFDAVHLVEVAQTTALGRSRLKAAYPYCLSEYGQAVRKADQLRYQLDWQNVPASVILDYVYGIDFAINWRGWIVGIDVTTSSDRSIIESKCQKLTTFKKMWQAIGIDCIGIVQLQLKHLETPSLDLNACLEQIV